MRKFDQNDRTVSLGSETMQHMDRPDSIPGLLRGPASWEMDKHALSTFSPSICVQMLADGRLLSPDLIERGRAGIHALTTARIGGDCWSAAVDEPALSQATVLVVAPAVLSDAFDRMIAAVLNEQAQKKVALLASAGSAPVTRRALARLAAEHGMIFIGGPTNAWSLLDPIAALYTIDDELGFLALLKSVSVRCFGNPFYAGYDLTEDDPAVPQRAGRRSLEEVFAAACLTATTYFDPYSKAASSFEVTCGTLADWRRINEVNRRIAVCMGMSFWKQRRMGEVLRSSDGAPEFHKTAISAIEAAKRRGGAIAVWAAREPADLASAAAEAEVPVVRVEDGFVRSVGLGADFTQAGSIVLDRTGIYFDSSRPSDLEHLLQTAEFDAKLIERAERLIHTLVTRGITKYNTGAGMPAIELPHGRRKLFVPGQVEDDRSVATGGAGIYRNIDLLKRVRALNPEAFIIYKPHPDVDAGHRVGAIPDDEALRHADHVVRGVSTAAIIPAVDEIHTLTSLAGFEALIRRRNVVVYGQPFYAGWGLTTDLAPVARRQRKLSLEELIAGSLVLYARYFDPVTHLPCGPEILFERLSHPELWRAGVLVVLRRLQGELMRRIGNFRTTKTSHVGTAHLDKRQKHVKPA
jgi:capsular polysaccharide export protein